jgi:hypothetical protein
MVARTQHIGDNFWNIRGSFKIGGLLDIKTHCSLVKLTSGKFVFLDAYTLPAAVKREVDALTDNGEAVEAIINLHPFHTVHVKAMHQQYPRAKLYGTARHVDLLPDLPWEQDTTESAPLQARYAADLAFSIPAGVDFISANDKVHFSSVLAYHPLSKTIHVDDTLMYVSLPRAAGMLGVRNPLVFHPTLPQALLREPGAARAFREWALALAQDWAAAENLCAAHTGNLLAQTKAGESIAIRIERALDKVGRVLSRHERKYG